MKKKRCKGEEVPEWKTRNLSMGSGGRKVGYQRARESRTRGPEEKKQGIDGKEKNQIVPRNTQKEGCH